MSGTFTRPNGNQRFFADLWDAKTALEGSGGDPIIHEDLASWKSSLESSYDGIDTIKASDLVEVDREEDYPVGDWRNDPQAFEELGEYVRIRDYLHDHPEEAGDYIFFDRTAELVDRKNALRTYVGYHEGSWDDDEDAEATA